MRIAALILSCVGLALAVSSVQVAAAQSVTYRENPSDALARNMRVLAASPRSFEALIGAGRAALQLGDTQAAAGFFGRAEEVHPASPLSHAGMGAAMIAEGDARGALAYFARAQQLGANGAMLGNDRGLALDLMARHSDAQEDYRAAMFGPDADEARRRLALSLAITGDKDGALAQLAPLIARGDPSGARCRALVLALSGDSGGARRSIDVAMPGKSAQMAPFLHRLPALTSSQKAAAVNLGIFPRSGQATVAGSSPPDGSSRSIPSSPVTGNRLASVEELLASPGPASVSQQQPAPQQQVQMASVIPARPEQVRAASSAGQPTEKPRIWLQLASGGNAAALPEQFKRISSRHRELFDGISGYVSEGPDRARLLIGPFKTSRDAKVFAEDLASVDVDAFSWTSAAGQTVRKLASE